ncbi:MAG: hypothetical protein R2828_15700 [Saprospiraceae bacterium]
MKLTLAYQETNPHAVCAAFVRSGQPSDWLQTLSEWAIPLDQLECYAVPTALNDIKPSGLFVIFKGKDIPDPGAILAPYGRIGENFYLPIHAQLFPPLTPAEWQDMVHYDRQLFHPTIGMVGFTLSDQIDFGQLLVLPKEQRRLWNLAVAGFSARPPLVKISVERPSTESILEALKEEMNTRPLEDIPGNENKKPGGLEDNIDELKQFLLKKALDVSKKLKETGNDYQSNQRNRPQQMDPYARGGSGSPSWFGGLRGRMEQWLLRQLEELEKKREQEVQRLLRLFEENPEEALRYSIPLEGPYQNRGTAMPSDRLGTRHADFNLSNLGGGNQVDSWNLDRHYYSLRAKYQDAAKTQLAAGNYRKAAYIYAHLLGDYHSAANALVQGKYFREAAILYKDHLKQDSKAAECLEQGGLILEAIELYEGMEKMEKIGDLYIQLDQRHKAIPYYENALTDALKLNNYLDGYRICEEKLKAHDRAKGLLLEGWKFSGQAENCLAKYFKVLEKEDKDEISEAVQAVYQLHTPEGRKNNFLNVLKEWNTTNEKTLVCRSQIAYEIISEQAKAGDISNLQYLDRFISNDTLLTKDASRYVYQHRGTTLKRSALPTVFRLDKEIDWMEVTIHNHQLLVLGIKAGRLHLARANWKGDIEYYSWTDMVSPGTRFRIGSSPFFKGEVFIYETSRTAFNPISLPANQHFFNALQIRFLYWLPENLCGITFDKIGQITALVAKKEATTLIHYNVQGEIISTLDCVYKGMPLILNRTTLPVPIYFRNNCYYTVNAHHFLRINEKGEATVVEFASPCHGFFASDHWTATRMIIATGNNCFYIRPSLEKLDAEKISINESIDRPVAVTFIAGRQLVIASTFSVAIYDLKYHKMLHRFKTKNKTIGVVASAGRKQFTLVSSSGLIQVYDISKA